MSAIDRWWSEGGHVPDELDYIQILHLEDSPDDADHIRLVLERGGLPVAITLVMGRSQFERAVESERFDLILCDYGIPSYNGLTALEFARRVRPEVPVIMLSGRLDDAQAVESLKSGATDYILKGKDARLVPAVRRALAEAATRRRQKAAEDRLRQQASLLDLTRDAIVVRTMDERIAYWNSGAAALFGWSSEFALGQDFRHLVQGDLGQLEAARQSLLQTGDWIGEFRFKGKGGPEIVVFSHWNLLRDAVGRPQSILSTNTDITGRKKTEEALLRVQRMESIGALASGIAHDLSNALAPILISTDVLAGSPDESVRDKVVLIRSHVQRATALVRQILKFVQGQDERGGPVVVTDLVREMERLARNTFPRNIEIAVQAPDTDVWKVQADPTELHQVILNICVNARDAMPMGGRLTMTVQNEQLDRAAAEELGGRAGAFVRVSIADTGGGVPPEVLPNIFEPFFTTKPPGQGTGLGLSTVAGIVRRHHGWITVRTDVGKGTEFSIYWPATLVSAPAGAKSRNATFPTGNGETILVVEDEASVLELTKETLENYGYRVVTASNGLEGVARFQESPARIHLLLTDTEMSPMSGLEAARAIRELRADLPVVIASATKPNLEDLEKWGAGYVTRLEKPYSLEQLLVAVAHGIKS